mgnify:CR=1 FL=1
MDKAVSENSKDKVYIPLIIVLSVLVPMAVAALLLFPEFFSVDFGIDRGTLPAFHAILNGSTAVLLILGLWLGISYFSKDVVSIGCSHNSILLPSLSRI